MPNHVFRTQPSPSSQTPNPPRYAHLTTAQIATWMHYGYVHIPSAFSRAAANKMTSSLWSRLNMSEHDPTTWHTPVTYLPTTQSVKISDFAPKAWDAICELCGGEERMDEMCNRWNDNFIVNLGSEKDEGKQTNVVEEVTGWHVDGSWFVHFLDSPEQGLLVVPCWSDVLEGGGATVICPEGITEVAKRLWAHPQGLEPDLKSRGTDKPDHKDRWVCGEIVDKCRTFLELSGEAGDVFVIHPLMIHSATKNGLRVPRIISNPWVSLKRPFDFDRDDCTAFSLIELKTLKELGRERLPGWRITGERTLIVTDEDEEAKKKAAKRSDMKEQHRGAEGQENVEQEALAHRQHQLLLRSRKPPPPVPPRH